MSRTPDHAVVDRDPRFNMQLVNLDTGRRALEQDTAYEGVMAKTREIFQNKDRSLLRRFGLAVWYSNIGRDLLQHRGKREATRTVRQAGGNYLTLVGGSQEDFQAETAAVVERFSDSVSNQFMLDQGETNTEMGAHLREKLNHAVMQYAEVDSDDTDDGLDDLKQQVEQFIKDYGPRRIVSYGHNIFEVAKNARGARRHGESSARINNAITGHYGMARAGVRTAHQREMIDAANSGPVARTLEAFGRNGLYGANEGTIGAALLIGVTAARAATRGAMGTATRAATFGLAGGFIAGARTYREEGRRQRHMLRKWAAGGETPNPEDARKLTRMEAIKYDSVHASKLYDRLSAIIKDVDGSDQETLNDAIGLIAEAQARRFISSRDNIDLITFASDKQIERERTLLYKRIDQAIDAVQRVYDNRNANQPLPARHGPRVHTPESDIENIHGNPADQAIRHGNANRGPIPAGGTVQDARSMVEARMHAARGGGRASIYQELMDDIHQRNRTAFLRRLGKGAMIGAGAAVVGGGIGYGIGELMNTFAGTEHAVTGALHDHTLPGRGRTGLKVSDHIKFNYHPGFHSQLIDNGHNVTSTLGWDRQGNLADKIPSHTFKLLHAHHELVRQGHQLFVGADGKTHSRFITEIWSPQDYHYVSQMPGIMPLYFLRPLEKMKPGEPRANIPETRLSTKVLAKSYLKSFDKRTGEMIDDIAKRLKDDPRNKNNVARRPKAVVMITADSTKDSSHIWRTLDQYRYQEGIDPKNDLEIVVFVGKRSNRTTQLISEIERYVQRTAGQRPRPGAYQHMKVRVVEQNLPEDKRSPRRIQELVTGAVISDLVNRGLNLDKMALLFNGAETKKVDKHYIETVLMRMNLIGDYATYRSPNIDMIVGQNGRGRGPDPARRPSYEPTNQRVARMMERYTLRRPGFLGVSRANMAFRPRAYMSPNRRRFDLGSYEYNTEVGAMVR